MRRLRALGYSTAVALGVFVYLALPTLRSLYGPVVNIPVYAVVALIAGGVVWAVLTDTDADRATVQPELEADGGGDEDVDDELAQLRDDL